MNRKHDESYRVLGLNVAYYRKLARLTQEQRAEKMNIDRSTISRIEIAWTGVSLDMLFDIADALGVDAYKLLMNPR